MRPGHGESESVQRLRRWSLCLPFGERHLWSDVSSEVGGTVHRPIQESESVLMSSSVGEHESVTAPTNGPPRHGLSEDSETLGLGLLSVELGERLGVP